MCMCVYAHVQHVHIFVLLYVCMCVYIQHTLHTSRNRQMCMHIRIIKYIDDVMTRTLTTHTQTHLPAKSTKLIRLAVSLGRLESNVAYTTNNNNKIFLQGIRESPE